MKKRLFYLLACMSLASSCHSQQQSTYSTSIQIADSILHTVQSLYHVEKYKLLSETYPVNPRNKVSYLAGDSAQVKQQEVAYLWPYSGMLSGAVALYHQTRDQKYLDYIERNLLPGLAQYWDDTRLPACYQSYPTFNGPSDRFYDDNDWIAIDLCDLYTITQNKAHLQRSLQLKDYIYSGWTDELGGGIYWCEQKRTSKNTCSNAPAAVLCAKLFVATGDSAHLRQAIQTYLWTKDNLRDPDDGVYYDNIHLDGQLDKTKYTYNSGQMIQAAVLLYKLTKDPAYLADAKQTAEGSYKFFVKNRATALGERPFYGNMPWFNVILFRGLKALYEIDKNPLYITTMRENAYYAWNNTRDENGLLGTDWTGEKNKKHKWLMDNACMIELFAEFNDLTLKTGK